MNVLNEYKGSVVSRNFLILLVVIVALLTLNCKRAAVFYAEKMLYPLIFVNQTETPATPPEGYEAMRFDVVDPTGDSEPSTMDILAWSFSAKDTSAPVILYFHGNGMSIGSLNEYNVLSRFEDLGVSFVAWDYPGYGLSTGKPSEPSILASAQAVLEWTKAKFPKAPLIIWGRSLGASIATIVTSNNQDKVSKLILTSPWFDFISVAKHHAEFAIKTLPKEWIAKHSYESNTAAERIQLKGIIHHGTIDTLIPIELGRRLHKSFPAGNVSFTEIEGSGHNEMFGFPKLWDDVRAFIQ